jgi:hypothetical protein
MLLGRASFTSCEILGTMLLLSASRISSLGFRRFHFLYFIDNSEENPGSHKYVVEKTMRKRNAVCRMFGYPMAFLHQNSSKFELYSNELFKLLSLYIIQHFYLWQY